MPKPKPQRSDVPVNQHTESNFTPRERLEPTIRRIIAEIDEDDRNSGSVEPKPAPQRPDWLETRIQTFGYWLSLEENSVLDPIELTRDEYVALKQHLAKMRGYAHANRTAQT
jgi:hypothetical protein